MALRVRVCRLEEVPADAVRAFAVPGSDIPVLVTRIAGEVKALSSMCPHEEVSLAGGTVADGHIRCPGHGYRFDLATGRCGHDASLVARTYPVTLVGDEVYVDLV